MRAWVVLVGLLLSGLVSLLMYVELTIGIILIGSLQIPPAVVFLFLLVVLANKALQKLRTRFALSPAELAMIYCMVLMSAMISGRGLVVHIIPMLAASNFYADPGNRWQELFFPNIKKWLVPFDPTGPPKQPVTRQFYEGLGAGQALPWREWVAPLAAWGGLCLLIAFAFLCLATILRRQWVDNEKLSFPLAQVPLELVSDEQGSSLFRNRPLWIGFAIPVLVFTLNGFHNWYPNLPEFPVLIHLPPLSRPWDAIWHPDIFLSFLGVGFSYLLPSQVLFSLWFFFLFSRIQMVVAGLFGVEPGWMPLYPGSVITGYQSAGAYVVLAGFLLYSARPYLRNLARAVFRKQETDDSGELLPYRVAVGGLLGCFALSVLWCYLAGLSLWVAAAEIGIILFIISVVLARSTAEAGLIMTESSFRPIDLYRMFLPVSTLGPRNMTTLALLDGTIGRDKRNLLLAGFLDCLRVADGVKVTRRAFLPGLVVAIVAAIVLSFVIQLWLPYSRGASSLYGYVYQGNCLWSLRDYQTHLAGMGGNSLDWRAPTFFAAGVAFTLFLCYMRSFFYWWPLHPIGYALAPAWSMVVLSFSCLVAWVIKSLVLRYGGMPLYRRTRPAFIGMMLGEVTIGAVFGLINALTGAPGLQFLWF